MSPDRLHRIALALFAVAAVLALLVVVVLADGVSR